MTSFNDRETSFENKFKHDKELEFKAPEESPLFQYLKVLSTAAERVAAGLFTLESIAYSVNETFMEFCDRQGDAETLRIYREYIQPDERAHQRLVEAAERQLQLGEVLMRRPVEVVGLIA